MKRHLTKLEIEKNERLPSYTTILKYFGALKIVDVWAEIDKIIIEREVLYNKKFSNTDKQYSHPSKAEIINAGTAGERKVSHYLSFLNPNKYKVYNNITAKANGRSQQVDHLVIGPNGIFHIETKNYSGRYMLIGMKIGVKQLNISMNYLTTLKVRYKDMNKY